MRRCSLLTVLLTLLAAGQVQARPPALEAGISAFNQMEYTTALMHLETARRQARTLQDRIQTYFYLGCTHYALEDEPSARRAFETLLALQPGFTPDRRLTSPKIADFFALVRQGYAVPAGPPAMTHQPPRAVGGQITPLVLRVQNISPRLQPMVRYREPGTAGFLSRSADRRVGNRFHFGVPTPADGRLTYHFVLVDEDGVVVQRLGPFKLAAGRETAAAGTPWYKTWWFWTAVGAVAVGTGVGLGLGLSGGDDSSRVTVTILRRDGSGNPVEIFP